MRLQVIFLSFFVLTACTPQLERPRDVLLPSQVVMTEQNPDQFGEPLKSNVGSALETPGADPLSLTNSKESDPSHSSIQESLFGNPIPGPRVDNTQKPNQETDLKLDY